MADDKLNFIKDLIGLQDELNRKYSSALDFTEKVKIQEELVSNQKKIQSEHENLISSSKNKNLDLTEDEKRELDKVLTSQQNVNKEVKSEGVLRRDINRQLKIGWDYLMQSDKVIRSTILNLGLSGAKAEAMRTSFEGSAGLVARLGGNLQDVQSIMEGFADETGRARALSADMIKDIYVIGKGTGLGVENAAKLGAQFQIMGVDARATMEYVQGVVDTTERMGVNTTKVLKNINDNFKKLNTFNFQQGSKGFAEMAAYAEKMKISMGEALNATQGANNLEKSIDLAAQLQVMGGEFAKTDPFELLYLSRNDPAKFTQKLSEMTKGIVSFKKTTTTDGKTVFEKFISPADRDRLRQVAQSLGISLEEMTEMTLRQADMGKMRQQLSGMGLSSADKELIESQGKFNTNTGKFAVQMGSVTKNISDLTAKDLNLLKVQKVSLEQRAKDAQTFEDAFKSTIAELKSALLPILRGINSFLTAVRPTVVKITEFMTGDKILPGWLKVTAGFLLGAAALRTTAFFWQKLVVDKLASSKLGTALSGRAGTGSVENTTRSSGVRRTSKNAGKGMMRGGAGIGAAALGIGAGIGAAAAGISLLADSMSKLDENQAEILKDIVITLGISIGVTAIAAVGILAFGSATAAASPALGAFALAALGVGAAIGIAGAGIGAAAFGISKLVESSKGAGESMLAVGGGIAMIAGSLALLANPLSSGGFALLAGAMGVMTIGALAVAKVASNMEKMGVAMKGTKDDWVAIQNAVTAIGKVNIKGGGMLNDLANLLKTPLKVQLSNNEIRFKIDIDGKTIVKNIPGEVLVQKGIDGKNGLYTSNA